jgi:hypothetical protein
MLSVANNSNMTSAFMLNVVAPTPQATKLGVGVLLICGLFGKMSFGRLSFGRFWQHRFKQMILWRSTMKDFFDFFWRHDIRNNDIQIKDIQHQ